MTALTVSPVHDPRPETSFYLGLDGIAAARISPYPKRRTDHRLWTVAVVAPALTASPRYEEFFAPRAVAAHAGQSGS